MPKKEETYGTHTVDELRQQLKAQAVVQPKTPVEQFQQTAGNIQNAVRQQQLSTEQQLQSTLSDASTYITNAQKLETISDLVQQIANMLQQAPESVRTNPAQYKQLLNQLQSNIAERRSTANMEVAQALSSAVANLSLAQTHMFAGYTMVEVDELIKRSQEILKQFESPSQGIH